VPILWLGVLRAQGFWEEKNLASADWLLWWREERYAVSTLWPHLSPLSVGTIIMRILSGRREAWSRKKETNTASAPSVQVE